MNIYLKKLHSTDSKKAEKTVVPREKKKQKILILADCIAIVFFVILFNINLCIHIIPSTIIFHFEILLSIFLLLL